MGRVDRPGNRHPDIRHATKVRQSGTGEETGRWAGMGMDMDMDKGRDKVGVGSKGKDNPLIAGMKPN
ncbi:hypothetical protein [Paenibacillus taichungensis]|uniref:hypothetical protein n=1 Tax=Paenibacillus taichungensis TaxID=484184 RepID=UPI0039A1C47C